MMRNTAIRALTLAGLTMVSACATAPVLAPKPQAPAASLKVIGHVQAATRQLAYDDIHSWTLSDVARLDVYLLDGGTDNDSPGSISGDTPMSQFSGTIDTSTPIALSGLAPNHYYHVRLDARDASGNQLSDIDNSDTLVDTHTKDGSGNLDPNGTLAQLLADQHFKLVFQARKVSAIRHLTVRLGGQYIDSATATLTDNTTSTTGAPFSVDSSYTSSDFPMTLSNLTPGHDYHLSVTGTLSQGYRKLLAAEGKTKRKLLYIDPGCVAALSNVIPPLDPGVIDMMCEDPFGDPPLGPDPDPGPDPSPSSTSLTGSLDFSVNAVQSGDTTYTNEADLNDLTLTQQAGS